MQALERLGEAERLGNDGSRMKQGHMCKSKDWGHIHAPALSELDLVPIQVNIFKTQDFINLKPSTFRFPFNLDVYAIKQQLLH